MGIDEKALAHALGLAGGDNERNYRRFVHWYETAREPISPDAPEGICRDCGGHNPVWFAPSPVWNLVMGGKDAKGDPGGVICPVCFTKRAENNGVKPTGWELRPETEQPDGCREAFEAECKRQGWDTSKEDLTEAYGWECIPYTDVHTSSAWKGFHAAWHRKRESLSQWQHINKAPRDGTVILVRTVGGYYLEAYWGDGLMNKAEQYCNGWFAAKEDIHPDCWTDGVCWEINADEEPSDQPDIWMPLYGIEGESK